jgi:hypothetical protein
MACVLRRVVERSLGLSMRKEIEQRTEDQRDVPTQKESLDQAEQESLPVQQLEAWEKD